MHMKTKLYGASDDLIEVGGAIDDEINHYNKPAKLFEFSDGTTGKIDYSDDGEWKIELTNKGILFDKLIIAIGDDPHKDIDAKLCSGYSDVLILKEGIKWVKIGKRTFVTN